MGSASERSADTKRTRNFFDRPNSDSPRARVLVAAVERPDAEGELNRAPGFALALNAVAVCGKNAAETIAIVATPTIADVARILREGLLERARVPYSASTAVGEAFNPRESSEFVMVRILV